MNDIDVSDYKVTSEVHVFSEGESVEEDGKSTVVISNFKFTLPSNLEKIATDSTDQGPLGTDEDGDPLLERRNHTKDHSLAIKHHINTSLDLVGLQVWRGALLLADFLLHAASDDKAAYPIHQDNIILELGAGTGLTSVVAGMVSGEVVSTDIDRGNILSLIKSNIRDNAHWIKDHQVGVEQLDFYNQNYNEKLLSQIERANTIIAADVVYHDDLTDAFLSTLKKIMSLGCPKTAFISLEKRFVFTIADLDIGAPCYDYFYDNLLKELSSYNIELMDTTKIPQYFCYERAKELVLIKVQNRK